MANAVKTIFVRRSTLPVAVKGKVGTQSITIGENGQVVISTLSAKLLNGSSHVGMAFQGSKVMLFVKGAKILEKVEDKDLIELRKAKEGEQRYFSGAAIFRQTPIADGVFYDFKGNGNQSFPTTWDEKNQALTFELPADGKMTRKVTAPRKKKEKTVTPPIATGNAPSAPAPVETEELVLEPV